MATRPKQVDWTGLNSLKRELVAWLEARNLVTSGDDELTVALKLSEEPNTHGPVVRAVARALYHIETFAAACSRDVGENLVPKDAAMSDHDRKLLTLMTDDSIEREADQAIRGLKPKLAHIERLLERIADLHVERAEAMQLPPDQELIERRHVRAIVLLHQLQEDARNLLRAFLFLSPSMPREAITLSGARRLEKRLRRALAEAGYP